MIFKKYLSIIIVTVLALSVVVHYVHAIDNTFQVSANVIAADNFPPSIPSDLIGNPISSSQINIIWTASTDNVGVAGYVVYRDGIAIATTTSVFYSDIGLTASTTYQYSVEAFDYVPHYSGQSATINVATPAEPIIPPEATTTPTSTSSTNTSSSGSRILKIDNLATDSTSNSSLISFNTNYSTQAKVFWGITRDYELGTISGLFYSFDHSVKISNLHSDTQYFYKIEVINYLGAKVSIEGVFQTQKNYNFISVANVTHFQVIPQENSIALSWNIPDNRDISSIRIVRSDRFFPRDINDGEIVYEGISQEYVDSNVIKDKLYYYTNFAKDSKGNYSSGVLAQARISTKLGQPIVSSSTDPLSEIKVIENVDSIIKALIFKDFNFIQDNKKIENDGEYVTVDGSKNLTILLSYDKVPEILKTIAITLTDPEDTSKIFTFLLRVDEEKTQYLSTIAPLGKSGKYKINIIVLDYKNQGLKRLQGTLNVLIWKAHQELFKNCGIFDETSKCTELNLKNKIVVYIILLILILIAIASWVLRKKIGKEDL